MSQLPLLITEDLQDTRDYLRDVTLAISAFQRGWLPTYPRQWQYGLEITMRGVSTQAFEILDHEMHVSLDLVRNNVRLGDIAWRLQDYNGLEIFNNLRVWLESKAVRAKLEKPNFQDSGRFDPAQAAAYAETLWWMHRQFQIIKSEITQGVTSPILLYPHHFDLALSWFPWDDERQLSVGYSTGDKTIRDPYIYFTAYPETESFSLVELPSTAYWQRDGFHGAVLPYSNLQASASPDELLRDLTRLILNRGRHVLT